MSYKLDQDTHLEVLEDWSEPPEIDEEAEAEAASRYPYDPYEGCYPYDPYDEYPIDEYPIDEYPIDEYDPGGEYPPDFFPPGIDEVAYYCFTEDILKKVTIPVNEYLCDLINFGMIIPNSTEYKSKRKQLVLRQLNNYLNEIQLMEEDDTPSVMFSELTWSEKETAVLDRDGHRCRLCNSDVSPKVHHRPYDNIGKESLSDLITLCHKCHKQYHCHNQYHDDAIAAGALLNALFGTDTTSNEPNLLDDEDDIPIRIPSRTASNEPNLLDDEDDIPIPTRRIPRRSDFTSTDE